MKFVIIFSLALLGAVAADVKHLNNMYLPPHMAQLAHRHVEYDQQSQEIPQVGLSFGAPIEITDNSVIEHVENQEQQQFTGKNKIDDFNYGARFGGDIQPQTEENKYYTGAIAVPHPEIPVVPVESEEQKFNTGLVYKPGQEESASTAAVNAETSVPAPGSDAFTQQQAAYYTSLSQQQASTVPVAEGSIEPSVPAPGSDSFTQQQAAYFTQQSQNQEAEKKYYTGLIAPTQGDSSDSTSISPSSNVEQVSQEPERQYFTGLIAPSQGDSSDSTSTTSTSTNVEQVSQEPERKYYNGLTAPSQGDSSASTSTSTNTQVDQVPQEPERQFYTGLIPPTQGSIGSISTTTTINAEASVPAPGSDDFTQQQATEQKYNTGLVHNNGLEPAGHIATTTTTTSGGQSQSLEQQQNYQTGLVYNPGQESGHSPIVVNQPRISVPAPGSDVFTQQQAAYWTSVSQQQQESAAPSLGASSGIETQYAADGGYVY